MQKQRALPKQLIAVATLLSFVCCAVEALGQRRAQMNVSCVVQPYISLRMNNERPVYGESAATLVFEPGQIQLTGATNDPKSSEFVVTVSSDSFAVVNGREVEAGQTVEVGHYLYGNAVMLNATGAAPIRLTASKR